MPYGSVLTDSITDSSGGVLAPSSSVFRNRIINGAMSISQGAAGATITPAVTSAYATNYPVDRFQVIVGAASKLTTAQSSVAPAGFNFSTLITSSSAYTVGSGEVFVIRQNIEGFNTADLGWGAAGAASITLSFWVRSSLTGTFGGSVQNSASNRSYPFTYSIASANTWEQKSVTIAGDTSGTWIGATNGIGLRVKVILPPAPCEPKKSTHPSCVSSGHAHCRGLFAYKAGPPIYPNQEIMFRHDPTGVTPYNVRELPDVQ